MVVTHRVELTIASEGRPLPDSAMGALRRKFAIYTQKHDLTGLLQNEPMESETVSIANRPDFNASFQVVSLWNDTIEVKLEFSLSGIDGEIKREFVNASITHLLHLFNKNNTLVVEDDGPVYDLYSDDILVYEVFY